MLSENWIPKTLISLILAVMLGWMVWQFTSLDGLLLLLLNISYLYLVLAFIVFLIFQYLRAQRMCVVLGNGSALSKMVLTICSQSVANGFLPAGLGEIALVYLLKQSHDVKYRTGAIVVLAVRLMDVLIFVAGVSLLLIAARDNVPGAVITVMFLVTAACVLLIIILIAITAISRIPVRRNIYLNNILQFVKSLEDAVRLVINNALGISVFVYTLLMWICMYIYFLFIVAALQAPVSALQVFWVYILVFPVNLLPIKGVANIGTHEAAWFLSLILLGFEDSLSASIAFGSHVLMLGVLIILGFIVTIIHFTTPLVARNFLTKS